MWGAAGNSTTLSRAPGTGADAYMAGGGRGNIGFEWVLCGDTVRGREGCGEVACGKVCSRWGWRKPP